MDTTEPNIQEEELWLKLKLITRHICFSALRHRQTDTHLASWSTSVKTNTSYALQTGRLNKAFSLRSKWKKTHGKTSFFVLIAKENQETGRPLVITSETSAEIGLTTRM